MKGIKVTYIVDSDEMSDGDYEDQPEQEFVINERAIREFIDEQVPTKQGEHIVWADSYYEPQG